MKSTVAYAKRRYMVSVFGSPGLLPSCSGPCVSAPLLLWRTSRCWRLYLFVRRHGTVLGLCVLRSVLGLPYLFDKSLGLLLVLCALVWVHLRLNCVYARLIFSVVAPGYRTPRTRYRFPGSVSGMSATGSFPLLCGTVGCLVPTGWGL